MPPGLLARMVAADAVKQVLSHGTYLEDELADASQRAQAEDMEPRDRAFARLLVTTVLRRHGELDAVLGAYLSKPLSARQGRAREILLCGAAQLLILATPPHAAIALAVEHCKSDRMSRHLSGLVNAVLRRVSESGAEHLERCDRVARNVPAMLLERWTRHYGQRVAQAIARASLEAPPLDLSVRDEPEGWAARLGGVALPTGTVRLVEAGRIEALAGYEAGQWWVQDAAAALPARLIPNPAGKRIADLCAAPGGKTAQLVAAGAIVTAVDVAAQRVARMAENLRRLKLDAELVTADVRMWRTQQPFDAILLDAPCSATGTIRRHPDILHRRAARDLDGLIALQSELLDAAASLVRPGGLLVYATCSLEREEGEDQVRSFLKRAGNFERVPVSVDEIGGLRDAVTEMGELRTLPYFGFSADPRTIGMDGFYAARLQRRS